MTTSDINIANLLKLADEANAAEFKKKAADGRGTWRVGSGGVFATIEGKDQVIGTCPRKAIARSMGIEEDIEQDKFHMFAAGIANEDVFCDRLGKCLPAGYVLKREEEIPISWTTKAGTVVSGRPDVVVCTTEGTPVVGVELKMVCSLWTARDVAFLHTPKSSAVIQAAHYADKLDVPYELWYTSPVNFTVPDWASRKNFFDMTSPYLELNEKGNIKHVRPFQVGYDITFNGGACYYAVKGESEWRPTIITKQNSAKFFDLLDSLVSMKRLGPRPSTYDCYGEKQTFDPCSYCSFVGACDKYEASWDAWFSAVRKLAR